MLADGTAIDGDKAADSRPKDAGKARLKTLEGMDARTRARKRAEDMRQKLIDDVGLDNLSQADLMRIDQTVFMSAVIEDMHVRALEDGKIDRQSLATLVNTCSRNLDAVTARATERKPRALTLADESVRDLSRAIMNVFYEASATLEDAPAPDANPTQAAPPATRSDSERPTEPATAPESPTGVYALSETATETQLSNGARVVGIPDAHGNLTRWRPIDLRGMEHHAFNDRAKAVDFAKTLPAIIELDHSEGPHVTLNGAEVDVNDIGGIPRECRESFFQPRRPRVVRSRQLRGY